MHRWLRQLEAHARLLWQVGGRRPCRQSSVPKTAHQGIPNLAHLGIFGNSVRNVLCKQEVLAHGGHLEPTDHAVLGPLGGGAVQLLQEESYVGHEQALHSLQADSERLVWIARGQPVWRVQASTVRAPACASLL